MPAVIRVYAKGAIQLELTLKRERSSAALIAGKEYLVPDQRGTDSGYRAIVSHSGKRDAANFGADSTAYRLDIEWAQCKLQML
jgi:hypothetical protein